MSPQTLNKEKSVKKRASSSKPVIEINDALKFQPTNATLEWLETNGLGGFSSSTINGMNTRRYHGLLTAAITPPDGRYVLLSKLEEDLLIAGNRFCLSTNQYGGAVYPQGYQYLQSFSLEPFPVWTYKLEGLILQKTLFMVHGENAVCIEYKIIKKDASLKDQNIVLELRPLMAFRGYHQTTLENQALNPEIKLSNGYFSFQPYQDLPALYINHHAQDVNGGGSWYKNFYYEIENKRGLDCTEDLFNPCVLTYDLGQHTSAAVMASLKAGDISQFEILKKQEIKRRSEVLKTAPVNNDIAHKLVLAADQFIVDRDGQKTIIAGYHWFGDWGRDTMIALPGLTLTTGRFDDAKNILLAFSKYIDQGMLPNRFGDTGQAPEYNTVDAALWYFEAIRQYGESTKNWDFIQENFYEVLKSIIDWHIKGTRYHIHMDTDGLIFAGQEGVQLTWMDAKVGDWVVTPRIGKPVEIQALWYNALCIMSDLAQRFNHKNDAKLFSQMADKAMKSFNQSFWNEAQGGLYDVINGDFKDDSIRPNQIFAASLYHSILEEEKIKPMVMLVARELLTPVGLRTLSKSHPDYKGIYQGTPWQRDGAYHQGTVWPWLLGPFIQAYIKAYGHDQLVLNRALQMLNGLEKNMQTFGLGQIAEIFDGDEPFLPKGCIAQAWSIGQTLQILKEITYG